MQHELLGQLNQFVLPGAAGEGLARARDADSPDDLGLGPAKRQKPRSEW